MSIISAPSIPRQAPHSLAPAQPDLSPRTELLLALLSARARSSEKLAASGFADDDLHRASWEFAELGIDLVLPIARKKGCQS
jgi:hypothetical protein